jgi:hypothetical protein
MNKKIEKVEAWGSVILKVREGSFNGVRVRTGESLLERRVWAGSEAGVWKVWVWGGIIGSVYVQVWN